MNTLTLSSVALRSIGFFIRGHAAVCLGIAAATAVIVGALVVGDSVRGSLRALVETRLANIDCLLRSRTFFGQELITTAAPPADRRLVPLIYLPSSSVEKRNPDEVHRSNHVQIFAVADDFWNAIDLPAGEVKLREDEVAINSSLAAELNAQVGDELSLRFESVAGVPADSPLGRREDSSLTLPRQKIVAVLPDSGVGSLSFSPNQSLPRNLFCSLASMQEMLECGPKANAALALSTNSTPLGPTQAEQWCQEVNAQLQPRMEDYGFQLERIVRKFPDPKLGEVAEGPEREPETIYDFYQLTSNQLLIDRASDIALTNMFGGDVERLLTYLANTIEKFDPLAAELEESGASGPSEPGDKAQVPGRIVPYSTIVGLEGNGGTSLSVSHAGAVFGASSIEHVDSISTGLWRHLSIPREALRSPYCWINSWLASQLDVRPGEWIQIKYFEPETVDGNEVERSLAILVVGVVPLTEPKQAFRHNRDAVYATAPTEFNDPHLTPSVPGLTDKESIASWDAPFKLDTKLILSADEDYYADYRLTPKIFTRYRTVAQPRVFSSRFGATTALRFEPRNFPDEGVLRAKIEQALAGTRASQGLDFVPIRAQLLASALGTTPFDMLFLSLSFFVIVAALLLVALLFKLGIQQRTTQLGLLAAQGFTGRRIMNLMMREMGLVAILGAGLGILLGMGYARLMLAALASWWVGAISTPFLSFHFTWQSLAIGCLVGLLMSLLTIYLAMRKLSRRAPLELLRGPSASVDRMSSSLNRLVSATAGFAAVGGIGLIVLAMGQTGMSRAGSFFGCGMLLLVSAVLASYQLLSSRLQQQSSQPSHSSLVSLAWSAIYRNPLRSTLTLGLLAVACFLIASMSVFHMAPDTRGYGGFSLLGESSRPIYRNIASPSVRSDVLGAEASKLNTVSILPFRVKTGDDASCNNLFQVSQPTVLGVPQELAMLNEFKQGATSFEWAATQNSQNPWRALEPIGQGTSSSPVPVILDQNTAAWSLKQGASLGALIQINYGQRKVYFRTVGLLANSVLQGKLMISEKNFTALFPEISGANFFMIEPVGGTNERVPNGQAAKEQVAKEQVAKEREISELLEKGWSNEGLDITSSRETLEKMLGVQNTYISAFQSLGALGLLLGTLGLIAVQVRSVNERRSELALMQAVGFSKSRLTRMLTWETVILLGGGLLMGTLSAAIALVPYLLEHPSQFSALSPLAMLGAIVIVGYVATFLAIRYAMKSSVLAGLRSE